RHPGAMAWPLTSRAAQPFPSSAPAAGPRSTRTITMFVCTVARSTHRPGSFASPSASPRALAWSSASRCTMRSSDTMPAAASTPTCRMPAPSILRQRRARSMSSVEPQITEPTGAESPFDRQKVTESTGRVKSAAGRPRAVRMPPYPRLVRDRGDGADLLRRRARAAVTVVCVLDAHEGRLRHMDVRRADRLTYLLGGEEAALCLDRTHLQLPDDRQASDLVVEHVRVVVDDDFLARPRVREHRDEVALRARRHEQSRRLAEPLGGQRLKPPHGGVLAEDVVAHLGARHGLAHLGRRLRERVRAKIDDVMHQR